MALDNSTTILVTNLAAYEAPRDTAAPVSTPVALEAFNFVDPPATLDAEGAAPASGDWGLLGHTAEETAVTLSPELEGNERRGSLQRPSLRRTPIRASWSLTIPALQADNRILTFVFGGGDVATADQFGIPKTYSVQQRALWVAMEDSENDLAMYFGLADVVPENEVSFGPDALTEFTLSAGVLDSDAQTLLGTIFRDNVGLIA